MSRPSWSRSEPPGWMADSVAAEVSAAAEQKTESGECGYPSESADVTGIVCERPAGHRGDHMAVISTYWGSFDA